jgi:hypothetical protein
MVKCFLALTTNKLTFTPEENLHFDLTTDLSTHFCALLHFLHNYLRDVAENCTQTSAWLNPAPEINRQ